MKCLECKKGRMVEKRVSETIEIEGAPVFEIEDVQVLECDRCHDVLMDAVSSESRTKKTVAKLVQYYSPRMSELPGKVAQRMRSALGLSQAELAAEVGGIDPSTFAHAAARNTAIDRYAALVLLSLCADYVSGGMEGRKLIERTKRVDQILGKKAAS